MNTLHMHQHHPLHTLRNEVITVRHWCSMNLIHDYHLWLYALIAALLVGFILLMVASWGRGVILNKELMYYVQSYGAS